MWSLFLLDSGPKYKHRHSDTHNGTSTTGADADADTDTDVGRASVFSFGVLSCVFWGAKCSHRQLDRFGSQRMLLDDGMWVTYCNADGMQYFLPSGSFEHWGEAV